jgi:predicted transcriptional regulator
MNPLRAWREKNGLRAVVVANRIGVSERSILAFESGGFEPSKETVTKLAALMEDEPSRIRLMFAVWKKGKCQKQ